MAGMNTRLLSDWIGVIGGLIFLVSFIVVIARKRIKMKNRSGG